MGTVGLGGRSTGCCGGSGASSPSGGSATSSRGEPVAADGTAWPIPWELPWRIATLPLSWLGATANPDGVGRARRTRRSSAPPGDLAGSFGGGGLADLLLAGMESGAALAALLWWPGDPSPRELRNKLAAYRAFRRGGAPAAPGGWSPSWEGLWLEEGAGFAAAVDLGRRQDWGALAAFAADAGEAGEAGEGSRLPRTSGVGLGLAVAALERGGGRSGAADVDREGLEWFLGAVERTVPADRREAALENLGLAVRMLRPEELHGWHRVLEASAPELVDLFWHGAGRGLYFAPTESWSLGALSGGCWGTLDRAWSEAPSGAPRRNAVAGLCWALTLVNLLDPQVVVQRCRGVQDRARSYDTAWSYDKAGSQARLSAASHGIASALALARSATGDDVAAERFLDAAGGGDGPWNQAVAPRVRRWLDGPLRTLEQEGRLASTFRSGGGEDADG